MELNGREYFLGDDGTMDTCIDVLCLKCNFGWRVRVSAEEAAHYRDPETGEMTDLEEFVADYLDDDQCQCCEGDI